MSHMVTANERDSGVKVVHGCFPEGGDSILFYKRNERAKRAHSLYIYIYIFFFQASDTLSRKNPS